MDLPGRVVEGGDVVLGEEVRRAVGAVEDADLPDSGYAGNVAGSRGGGHAPRLASTRSTSPDRTARPAVPAEAAQHERGLRAQVRRYVEAAAHREVRRGSRAPAIAPISSSPPGRDAHGSEVGDGRSVEGRLHPRAGERDHGIGRKRSVGPLSVISRPAAPSSLPATRLATDSARSSIGPGRRNADRPGPTRPGRSCTVVCVPPSSTSIAVDLIRPAREQARRHVAGAEGRRGDHLPQVREVRLDARDPRQRQRPRHARRWPRRACAPGDDLRQQRVVER